MIEDLAGWERTAAEPREVGSLESDVPVWEAPDPLDALNEERDNPTRVFLLGPKLVARSEVG